MLKSLVLLAAAASGGLAAVVKKSWTVDWVTASPDGFARPVVGINGQWPCPSLHVDAGDKLVVHVTNNLGNQSTSIHWHGILHHDGSAHMDGAAFVAQCPIPPGESFTYEFVADQPGTYWYHAHIGAQYSDGFRAPLIVHDKKDPYKKDYDEEYVLTVSDWYHKQAPTVLAETFSKANVQVRPPLPDSALINDGQRSQYKMKPGKRYKFRIVNMAAFAPAFLTFEGHTLSVVEVDSVYTRRAPCDQLYITPGQRFSVIVEARRGRQEENFAISAVFDMHPDWRAPLAQIGWKANATAHLQYDAKKPYPPAALVSGFKPFDDLKLMPHSDIPLLGAPDQRIQVDFRMGLDADGIPRAFFNNVSYVTQKTPTLYTALTVGDAALNPAVYGQVNPYVIKHGQVIEVTLNNLTPGHHPFHLHGHHFQVFSQRSAGPNGTVAAATPMLRDSVDVPGLGSAVVRFRADNPGVWLFHCHIEWHMPMGMAATFIEDPLALQKKIPKIPKDHLRACKKGCWPSAGNAAGNTVDVLDLTGQTDPKRVPLHGATFQKGDCGTDGPGGPGGHGGGKGGDGNDGDSDGSGGKGGGKGGDGNDGDSDGSGGHGGGKGGGKGGDGNDGDSDDSTNCPADCTCSGPVILDPPKGQGGSCKDGVRVRYVTKAHYVTSRPTYTSTTTVCAKPTAH